MQLQKLHTCALESIQRRKNLSFTYYFRLLSSKKGK